MILEDKISRNRHSWRIPLLMEKHASLPFNPDIANVFFRAGMVESWGRGIERIMQACSDADLLPPARN